MNFKEFQKELKDVKYLKYHTEKDWEIFLSFNICMEKVQAIIVKCRQLCMVNWHLIVPEPTEDMPEPEIRMYWDVKKDTI